MTKAIQWSILIGGAALVLTLAYHFMLQKHATNLQQQPLPTATESPVRPTVPDGAPRYPLPAAGWEKPLPALDTSDATIRNDLRALWSDKALEERFHLKDFIRRVVATIDNLPRRKIALQLMPVRSVDGSFAVTASGDDYVASSENASRYAPYIRLFEAVDPAQLVALYVRFYPLFQQAYEELGYPQQYFNDRMVAVIDDVLATPDVQEPVKLIRPKVFYLFADPELEDCSAGQKILIRMGSANAAKVKARLQAVRAELARRTASAGHLR